MMTRQFVLAVSAVICMCAACHAADRMALVIGNSKYGGDAALSNPANDADAVEQALTELGFTVIKKKDVDLEQIEDVLVEYRRKLPKGGLGLFYFAGHGVQVDGNNYLVPVGAKIREEFEVKRQCVNVDQVMDAMAESESNLKVLILDCCRNNPFKRSWKRGLGDHGLKAIDNVPDGTIIAYSTAAGKAADDGEGKNSPYAEQLVKALRSRPAEGLELVNVFRKSGHELSRLTGQKPWLHIDTSIDEYFLRAPGSTATKSNPSVGTVGRPSGVKLPSTDSPSKLPKEITSKATGMKLVLIPAGEFMMGSESEDGRFEHERPQHKVRISKPFYIGKHEVTLKEFLHFYHDAKYRLGCERDGKGGLGIDGAGGTDRKPNYRPWSWGFKGQTQDHPLVNVTWNDAKEFCKWLGTRDGRIYRLPTEAEWEYACRAGTTTEHPAGNKPSELVKIANVCDDSLRRLFWADSPQGILFADFNDGYPITAPVGSLAPNAFGLHDMIGNVSEWCEDVWDDYEKSIGVVTDPLILSPTGNWDASSYETVRRRRVVRGSDWSTSDGWEISARSAARYGQDLDFCGDTIGFRVVAESE